MATRKSTTTKKNDEFVLTDDILVGKIQVADKQHIAISLVKHEGEVLSINQENIYQKRWRGKNKELCLDSV